MLIELTVTFTVTEPVVKPVAVPVTVVEPAVNRPVTVITAVEEPEETVTLAGTVATAVLLLVRLTTTPLDPAAWPRVRMRLPVWLALSARGDGENVILVFAPTVIVTVAGADARRPSLTISSAV
jgi:hypothetical protein